MKSSNNLGIKKVMIILQFMITIILITGSGTFYNQMNYIMNKPLGYDRSDVVIIPVRNPETVNKIDLIINEFSRHAGVKTAAAGSAIPGNYAFQNGFFPDGSDNAIMLNTFDIHPEYLPLMRMQLVEGRNFSADHGSQGTAACIINEAAAERLGWQSAIDKSIDWVDTSSGERVVVNGRVIGVVKDFHYSSLHRKIEPLVIRSRPGSFNTLILKLEPGRTQETMDYLQTKWKDFDGSFLFEYYFMEEGFNNIYNNDRRFAKLFNHFTLLAVTLSCLGLFALTSYFMKNRTKEIGIRKTLGANKSGLTFMLTYEMLKLIGVSFVIAAPVSFFVFRDWLENFAYRTELSVGIFVCSGFAVIALAIFSIVYKILTAVRKNPVDCLDYE